MICVAIQEKNVSDCLRLLGEVEMAEIRIDLAGYDEQAVRTVFSSTSKKLVATCRPPYSDAERMKLLKTAIECGAAYVDIEIESGDVFKEEMVAFAHQHGTKVIVSYHNFDETPGLKELHDIIDQCFASGADVAKIAAMVKSEQDSARLLGLYDTKRTLIVLGMGQLGKITRLAATLLGSPFTFAAKDEASATAPGQVSFARLERMLHEVKK